MEVEITIDSRKTKSQKNPFDWIYGIVVEANGLEKELAIGFSGHQIQMPAKTRIEEKWIAMLTVVVASVIRQLKLERAGRLKLYICQDLTCSIPKKLATLIAAVAEIMQVPSSSISAEFVTRKGSRSRLALAVRYNKAHRVARREKVDIYCNPQMVEKVLKIVHRMWIHR